MAVGLASSAFAAEEGKPKTAMNRVTGEVSAISTSGIAVEFSGSGESVREIYLPLTGKTKFQRFANPAQLKPGDTVQVVYEQTYREPEKGKKIYLGATAVEVTLLKQAPVPEALVSKKEGAR